MTTDSKRKCVVKGVNKDQVKELVASQSNHSDASLPHVLHPYIKDTRVA